MDRFSTRLAASLIEDRHRQAAETRRGMSAASRPDFAEDRTRRGIIAGRDLRMLLRFRVPAGSR